MSNEFEPTEDTDIDAAADALLQAYRHARNDGDVTLLKLIEAALLHVGWRLSKQVRDKSAAASSDKGRPDV